MSLVEFTKRLRPWYTGKIRYLNGDVKWYRNGVLHRDDGPAVEHANGDREWYRRGLRHRADGPAVERADGMKEWWQDGVHFRACGGPVVECPDGHTYSAHEGGLILDACHAARRGGRAGRAA